MSTQLSSVDSFIDRAAKEFTFGLKAIAAEKPPRPEFCRNCVATKGVTCLPIPGSERAIIWVNSTSTKPKVETCSARTHKLYRASK